MNRIWMCGQTELDLSSPKIMGIVNVTTDSFSDGGKFFAFEQAVEHALRLSEEGADILDVGGESTRPGALEVPVEEELERVVPVIAALSREGLLVSVDTSKAEVMREAAAAGAQIINDVYALRREGALKAAAEAGCGVCLMHMKGEPRTMQLNPRYDNLIEEVKSFLISRADALISLGADPSGIVLDPGFGFGKTVSQNFELLEKTESFAALGYPLLYGMSRKSSLGAVTGVSRADERVNSSVAAHLLAVAKGASVVRVHDVKQMKEALSVYNAMTHYKDLE